MRKKKHKPLSKKKLQDGTKVYKKPSILLYFGTLILSVLTAIASVIGILTFSDRVNNLLEFPKIISNKMDSIIGNINITNKVISESHGEEVKILNNIAKMKGVYNENGFKEVIILVSKDPDLSGDIDNIYYDKGSKVYAEFGKDIVGKNIILRNNSISSEPSIKVRIKSRTGNKESPYTFAVSKELIRFLSLSKDTEPLIEYLTIGSLILE